ncbi:Hypothetical predicted protein [Prunus dulcis]|uniref:Uncharacterized protein n=1 Tax=Prunus dulcis TaxID=3755 RepID=A0A5E4GK19_PRUDU|nr:Hypothetical predicted protein [Prunus dulcis]
MAKLLSIAVSALFIILLLELEIVLAHSSTGPHRPILPIKEIKEVKNALSGGPRRPQRRGADGDHPRDPPPTPSGHLGGQSLP